MKEKNAAIVQTNPKTKKEKKRGDPFLASGWNTLMQSQKKKKIEERNIRNTARAAGRLEKWTEKKNSGGKSGRSRWQGRTSSRILKAEVKRANNCSHGDAEWLESGERMIQEERH